MATVLVTGGTGLVGKALCKALLEKGYRVIIFTRNEKKVNPGLSLRTATRGAQDRAPHLQYSLWNVNDKTIDKDAFASADFIIHLAGAGIADKRWTKKRMQEIVNSRVGGSDLIATTLASIHNNVKAVISASAIGWYGPDPSNTGAHPFSESDPPAKDFLGETCRKWESSIGQVAKLGKRVVCVRTGIVISKEGGAIVEFLKPLRFGIAAILGKGRQVISWIHIDDLVNIYITAIENEHLTGAYNAVTPQPVTNREFSLQLARSRKTFFIPLRVPSFVLKLVLGEMSIEVLKSATISCEKIQNTGFSFQYPDLASAFREIKNK